MAVLGRLPQQGLVFWGDDDPFVPPETAERFCRITNTPLYRNADTGHWSIVEKADTFAALFPDAARGDRQALAAAGDHVVIKISMLCYTDPKWDENPEVAAAVKKVIELFGVSRCWRCMSTATKTGNTKYGSGVARFGDNVE
mgnify:CR=1 FL=1